jgi:hypothetical protein
MVMPTKTNVPEQNQSLLCYVLLPWDIHGKRPWQAINDASHWSHRSPPNTGVGLETLSTDTCQGTRTIEIHPILSFTGLALISKAQSCAYFPILPPADRILLHDVLPEVGVGVSLLTTWLKVQRSNCGQLPGVRGLRDLSIAQSHCGRLGTRFQV